VLTARDDPRYFAALKTGQPMPAEDAHADSRTNEFSVSYLEPHGIGDRMLYANAALASLGMSALLNGVSPTDPITYAAVAIALGAVTLATYLPARRASGVQLVIALRSQIAFDRREDGSDLECLERLT